MHVVGLCGSPIDPSDAANLWVELLPGSVSAFHFSHSECSISTLSQPMIERSWQNWPRLQYDCLVNLF